MGDKLGGARLPNDCRYPQGREMGTTIDVSVLRTRRAVIRAMLRLGGLSGLTASSSNLVPITFDGVPERSGASSHQSGASPFRRFAHSPFRGLFMSIASP